MHREFFCEIFSAGSPLSVENRAEQVALLRECMYIKTIHDKSVPACQALSLCHVVFFFSLFVVDVIILIIVFARDERVSTVKMFKILRHTYQNEVDIN